MIACEESQAECMAFRKLGHIAYSCDIQRCGRGRIPGWHINADVRPLLGGQLTFQTQDGKTHSVPRWDLIIAHPPCTYLCKVSSQHLYKNPDTWIDTAVGKKYLNQERYTKMMQGRDFFFQCLHADAPYLAVENPLPMRMANLPRPSCYADPSWFGVPFTKKTLYWLKNLPPIMAGATASKTKEFVRCSRGKYRSRTFTQLANAIATQWSEYITTQMIH